MNKSSFFSGQFIDDDMSRLYSCPLLTKLIQSYTLFLYRSLPTSLQQASPASSQLLSSSLFQECPVPSESEISSCVHSLFSRISTSRSVPFIAILYLSRLPTSIITHSSLYTLITGCALIAAKFLDDDFYALRNNAFVASVSQLPLDYICSLESLLLKQFQYRLNVKQHEILDTEERILRGVHAVSPCLLERIRRLGFEVMGMYEFEEEDEEDGDDGDWTSVSKRDEYCVSTSPVSAFYDGFGDDFKEEDKNDKANNKIENNLTDICITNVKTICEAETPSQAMDIYYCDEKFIL